MTKQSESLKSKTVKGSFWSFADNLLNTGISFIVSLVLARLLSPHEYGLIGIIMIFVALFNCIVDSGFSNALIRKKDATDEDYNTVFLVNLIASVVLFVLMFFGAPLIGRFFNQPQLIPLSRAMSSVIVINAFALIQKTLLEKRIDFKTQTKISFISSVSSGVIGIAMAMAGLGVWALVGQQISRQILNTIFLWKYGHWWPKFQFSMNSFKELFGFGWKLLVSSLIDTAWREVYQVVIGKCYSSASLGLYTRAQQFASLPSSNVSGVIGRVTYPVLSSIQDDKERLKEAYRKVIKITMLVTFVLMLGMAAVAKPMVQVLIGDQWLPCVAFLQIICFNYMMYPLHALNLNMLKVQGRSDLFLRLEIIKKIVAVGPLLLGIFFNIYWMLIGSVLAGFFAYYLNAYYSGPYLKYSIWQQIKDILPSFGIALFMALIVFLMNYLPLSPIVLLILQVLVGSGLVVGLCILFKIDAFFEIKNIVLSYIKKK